MTTFGPYYREPALPDLRPEPPDDNAEDLPEDEWAEADRAYEQARDRRLDRED